MIIYDLKRIQLISAVVYLIHSNIVLQGLNEITNCFSNDIRLSCLDLTCDLYNKKYFG